MKLFEKTPDAYMCGTCGCGCPAVFATDRDTYVIIGKKPTAEMGITHAADEAIVIVEQNMIKDI